MQPDSHDSIPAGPGEGNPEHAERAIPADAVDGAGCELDDTAMEVWREILARRIPDADLIAKPGKVRRQIQKTCAGRGTHLYVAASMHAHLNGRKAKGRHAARVALVTEAARLRQSALKHFPGAVEALDAAIQHAVANPAPLPKRIADGRPS